MPLGEDMLLSTRKLMSGAATPAVTVSVQREGKPLTLTLSLRAPR